MRSILVETIAHSEQRYDTVGDWYFDGLRQRIRVSSLGSLNYEFLIAVHELIEWFLCENRGISEATVDAFDKHHLASPEPGNLKDAPYHREHQMAMKIERMLAKELGVDWKEYCTVIDKL